MTSWPVTRPAPELPAGPRAALVVATSSYSDPALPSLGAVARDAIDMAGVLADQSIGGFDVTSVLDGTAREIRLAVQDFLDGRGREDLLLVYLSGHGLLDKYEKLYFAGTDTSEDTKGKRVDGSPGMLMAAVSLMQLYQVSACSHSLSFSSTMNLSQHVSKVIFQSRGVTIFTNVVQH